MIKLEIEVYITLIFLLIIDNNETIIFTFSTISVSHQVNFIFDTRICNVKKYIFQLKNKDRNKSYNSSSNTLAVNKNLTLVVNN